MYTADSFSVLAGAASFVVLRIINESELYSIYVEIVFRCFDARLFSYSSMQFNMSRLMTKPFK